MSLRSAQTNAEILAEYAQEIRAIQDAAARACIAPQKPRRAPVAKKRMARSLHPWQLPQQAKEA